MEPQSQDLKTTPSLSLERFHISEDYGFLLPNPLVRMELGPAQNTFLEILICLFVCLMYVVVKRDAI